MIAITVTSLLLPACSVNTLGMTETPDAAPTPTPDAGTPTPSATAWLLSDDADANAWVVTIVDPTAEDLIVDSFGVDDLAVLSGPQAEGGNGQGPTWSDAVLSTDSSRVFVNAQSVARVADFETAPRSLETVLDVGERPDTLSSSAPATPAATMPSSTRATTRS